MLLSDAITQYVADRRAKGYKHSTTSAEARTLRLLLADVGNIQTTNLRPQHLDLFWSNRTTWGPGSMNLARFQLRSFFQWCQARGYIKNGLLLHGTRTQRVPSKNHVLIPQNQFSSFLEGILQPRTRVACAIGLYVFCRKSETTALRWRDIDWDNRTIAVFREKTTQLDHLPICNELLAELKRWRLVYAATIGRQPLPTDYVVPAAVPPKRGGIKGQRRVFVALDGGGLIPDRRGTVTSIVKSALIAAGYYRPQEGTHTLRRSGAVALYHSLSARGHDKAMRICQWMLGHASIRTTEIYLQIDLETKSAHDLFRGQDMFPAPEQAEVVSLSAHRS